VSSLAVEHARASPAAAPARASPPRPPLRIAAATDPLEHEADRVAERALAPSAAPPGILQRACACGGTPGPAGECAECKARRLQRERLSRAGGPGQAPPIVHEVLASPGRPLDRGSRSFFEQRLGRDLGRVRVHTDDRSAESAAAVDARAYTVGEQIVFGRGEYAPATGEGQRLLAHELAHTLQQGGGRELRRQAPAPAPAPAPAAAFGPACGAPDPCLIGRCANRATITGDLARASTYVQNAIAALTASPLAADTVRALDWYFNSHTPETVSTARTSLTCIQSAITDTSTNSRFGCHPGYDALAYVCAHSHSICTDSLAKVCFTSQHFDSEPRVRAQTAIHECAHRVGMSLGRPNSVDDIYRFTTRFLYQDTRDLLLNSDSYALFAGAISEGVRSSLLFSAAAGYGFASPTSGRRGTWQANLYLGAELQHPVLGLFSPTLGLGFTLIGESTGEPGGAPSGTSLLTSLRLGARLSDPRPGGAGGGYFSVFGGPALAVEWSEPPGGGTGPRRSPPGVRLGAEAGFAVGYRWRWIDVSAGAGYLYDPVRAAGERGLVTGTLTLTFTTGDVRPE
jgi:hypothetical protein